jgi:hypothetical protein
MLLLEAAAAAAAKRVATKAAKTNAGAARERGQKKSKVWGEHQRGENRRRRAKKTAPEAEQKYKMIRLHIEHAEDAEALKNVFALAPGLCLSSRVRSP